MRIFGRFPDVSVKEQELTCTMFHPHGKTTAIEAYEPHSIASFGETEADKVKARLYCRLGDAIVALTPFAPYRD